MKSRARIVLVLVAVAVASSSAVAACMLADPPPIQPIPPPSQPVIETFAVSPPLGQTIGALPSGTQSISFAVPVSADVDQALQWRVFVDLDQLGPGQTPPGPVRSGGDDGGVLGTVVGEAGAANRVIEFTLQASQGIDFSACHKFTIVVAYQFVDPVSGGPTAIETPVYPPGGARADWSYEPVADCTYYDAAPPYDASPPDLDAGDAD
jgi:hypothetical protein